MSMKLRLVRARSRHLSPLDGARRWDALSCNWGLGSNLDQSFGERLRILRIALGNSEAEMAAAIGISVRLYRKWEKGYLCGKIQNLVEFCCERDISLDWLLRGDARGLRKHVGDRVVILPVLTPKQRERALLLEALPINSAFSLLPRPKQEAIHNFRATLLSD